MDFEVEPEFARVVSIFALAVLSHTDSLPVALDQPALEVRFRVAVLIPEPALVGRVGVVGKELVVNSGYCLVIIHRKRANLPLHRLCLLHAFCWNMPSIVPIIIETDWDGTGKASGCRLMFLKCCGKAGRQANGQSISTSKQQTTQPETLAMYRFLQEYTDTIRSPFVAENADAIRKTPRRRALSCILAVPG